MEWTIARKYYLRPTFLINLWKANMPLVSKLDFPIYVELCSIYTILSLALGTVAFTSHSCLHE